MKVLMERPFLLLDGNIQVSGSGLWSRFTAGVNPTCTPHSGAGMAITIVMIMQLE